MLFAAQTFPSGGDSYYSNQKKEIETETDKDCFRYGCEAETKNIRNCVVLRLYREAV